MRTAYKRRAYPTPEQAAMLSRTFGCARLVWNRLLAWRHARWHTQQLATNVPAANAYLTQRKADPDLAFLREVSSVPLQQVTRTQQAAFANFVAGRARYPRFKSRTGRQSAEYTRSGFRWRDGQLWLAKAICDCGWGTFRRLLEYKAARAGRTLVVIDRWYPSSKTCSACGHLLATLSLSTRHWTCPGCRTRHDRDLNAAKNIVLAAGLAVTACGGGIRHPEPARMRSPVKQEPQPVRVGTPRR